jgi:hypothetical protein
LPPNLECIIAPTNAVWPCGFRGVEIMQNVFNASYFNMHFKNENISANLLSIANNLATLMFSRPIQFFCELVLF